MIAEFLDRDEVGGYVAAVRDQLKNGRLDDRAQAAAAGIGRPSADTATAVQSVLDALPDDNVGAPSSGESNPSTPFLSRDPMVSLLQTSLEDEARKSGIVHEPEHLGPFGHIACVVESIERKLGSLLDPVKFSTHDPDWVTKIGQATLDRIAKGNHPFNPAPAECDLGDHSALRLVIVGDWGTGLPHARQVSQLMAAEISEAQSRGVPVHVVHLGDVYYSGDPVEVQRRVLADGMWPVTAEQAAQGVGSWSLNGNHDMYAGGWGYFETLLGDERFRHQRSPDGKPTSFFRIRHPQWDLIGLDTSWDTDALSHGKSGVLADPQAEIVHGWAQESADSGRKLMLLSHHQLISAYDQGDIGTVLPAKLAPLLDSGQIAAWVWGHEHRCMGFEATHGIPYVRCIGHGGVPVGIEPQLAAGTIPTPGVWQEAGSFEECNASWHKFGFAVFDFDGAQVQVRYRDDDGSQPRTESIT